MANTTTKVETVSVACQTEPNLIDKLIDNNPAKKQVDDVDLYQDYLRSAQCAQFWPLDKNPIRSLVPSILQVDLPEQHLKNESLMFDLVQAITNNSKLVNLLAKYIHHIVPNVIISKRIDLIPLITCTIRVCRDTGEQERLISLLFNLIKRPNEEQRRMILSGMIVVLQVSPHQSSSLLLPNLWDHVNDKFPERRILLAESCATLAHYVRPIMRTNLILSILIQLLKDKNAAVRSAACKSFACLLSLIMDRNDEVFDACLSATEDIIQDVLQQTPVNFCEHRFELEQMRFCTLETIYPLLCMWAVKLNRFKVEIAEFYLAKAERCFSNLINQHTTSQMANGSPTHDALNASLNSTQSSAFSLAGQSNSSVAAEAVAKRRSIFFESRQSSWASSQSSGFGGSNTSGSVTSTPASYLRRKSAFSTLGSSQQSASTSPEAAAQNGSNLLIYQRAISAYLKMLNYLVPFVFSDAVHSCAWLSKSKLHLPVISENEQQSPTSQKSAPQVSDGEHPRDINNNGNSNSNTVDQPEANDTNDHLRQSKSCNGLDEVEKAARSASDAHQSATPPPLPQAIKRPADRIGSFGRASEGSLFRLFERPVKFGNKLLEPTLIIDESAIVAFHDQLEQEHILIESIEWILSKFLPKFLTILAYFSNKKFYSTTCNTTDILQEFLFTNISSIRQLCLLFGKHLTRTKIRPLIKQFIETHQAPVLYYLYIASLTSFDLIEQQEYEEIVASIRQNLTTSELTRSDVEILAVAIKIIATNDEQIHSPSTRQKFLTYILDALVNYSNHTIRTASSSSSSSSSTAFNKQQQSRHNSLAAAFTSSAAKRNSISNTRQEQLHQTQTKEFMLIIFRHILSCLIDPLVRPLDWAHILVTKFLPLIILLANDSSDVHVCTYARLMCAQLVETFDTYLSCPKLTKQGADSIMPALSSLKGLTEQIKASNLNRQIESLTQSVNEKFFNDNKPQQQDETTGAPQAKVAAQ